MSKQTAVEWLFQQIYGDTGHIGSYTTDGKDAFEAFEKAKAMEREQIIEAFDEGQEYEYQYHVNGTPKFDSETYFNETYKGD